MSRQKLQLTANAVPAAGEQRQPRLERQQLGVSDIQDGCLPITVDADSRG